MLYIQLEAYVTVYSHAVTFSVPESTSGRTAPCKRFAVKFHVSYILSVGIIVLYSVS